MAGSDADLLAAALKALGLTALNDGRRTVLCDSSGRKYICFQDGDFALSSFPADLRDFLKVEYFEYYNFSSDYNVIYNPFRGMSSEELELRLAVAGGRLG